jgi:hypothetical protein
MTHSTRILIVSAALLCGGDVYSAGEEVFSKAISAEGKLLEACKPRECPVYYVSAIERTFPIPDRYMLGSRSTSDPLTLRFVSPIPEFASLKAAVAGEEMGGMIVIGPIEELRKSEKAGRVELKELQTIDGVKLYSMSFSPGLRRAGTETRAVALIGTADYIMISDDNPKLPELLLRLSVRVKVRSAR